MVGREGWEGWGGMGGRVEGGGFSFLGFKLFRRLKGGRRGVGKHGVDWIFGREFAQIHILAS